MKDKNRLMKQLLNIDYFLAGLSLVILVSVTFFGVIMRYFFNAPFVWQEEVQLACLVCIIFIGAGVAFRNKGHIAIDVVVDLMPKKLQRIVGIFGYLVTTFVLIFFIKNGMIFVEILVEIDRRTNILRIPYYLIYSMIPLGCLAMLINHTLLFVEDIFHKFGQN